MIVSRYIKEETDTLQADVEFITPAFLGGADGNAELRAAPFKGMLRYWWRILYSAKYKNNLQQKESEMFGSTAETGKAGGKSSVLLSIQAKSLHTVLFDRKTFDARKVSYINAENRNINTVDYLAYGHYDYDKELHHNKYIHTAIQPGSTFSITITVPKVYSEEVFQAFLAMVQYGGIGSKCRNGFGSMRLVSCKVNGIDDAAKTHPKLWHIHDTSPGFSALSDKSRLYKAEQAENCWEAAFYCIAKIYITQVRRLIARYEKTVPADKNARQPKFLLLSVAKEKDGFHGQILTLPAYFDSRENQPSSHAHSGYCKMVNDVAAVLKETELKCFSFRSKK